MSAAQKAAVDWNLRHPVGSPVLAWPGTRDQEPLRTRTRTPAWALPSGDAIVSVRGHAGGIALTHVDHDPTRREPPPDLEHRAPLCPLCDKEVDVDGDAFVCHGCEASWDMSGDGGKWYEDDAPACQSAIKPHDRPDLEPRFESIRHNVERCVLPDDHDDKHRGTDSWTTWSDDDSRVVTPR